MTREQYQKLIEETQRGFDEQRRQIAQQRAQIARSVESVVEALQFLGVPATAVGGAVVLAPQPDPTAVSQVVKHVRGQLIAQWVAAEFGLSHATLMKSRQQPAPKARFVGYWLCRELLGMPLESVGKVFGRDHSTVRYGSVKVQYWLHTNDTETVFVVERVKAMFERAFTVVACQDANSSTREGEAA